MRKMRHPLSCFFFHAIKCCFDWFCQNAKGRSKGAFGPKSDDFTTIKHYLCVPNEKKECPNGRCCVCKVRRTLERGKNIQECSGVYSDFTKCSGKDFARQAKPGGFTQVPQSGMAQRPET